MGFLQVLLWILKILGILFVSVIALLLVSVLLVLFVPVRYRAQGHKAEDYGIEARISWLLHIFRVQIKYVPETKLSYEVHLLWFLFLSNDETWKAAHEEKKKKKAEKKARKAEKKKQKKKEKRAKIRAKQKKKQGSEVVKRQVAAAEKTHVEVQPERTADTELQEESTTQNILQQNHVETEKLHWFARICDKIRALLQKLKQKLKAVCDTMRKLWKKADTILSFLREETNKAAFGASWTTLVQILKHIGPTKIKGSLTFGMDDPATTGYILAILGIFYGKFGKSFSIRPNFEEKQFETEFWVKGRVRMSRLLYLVWKLWKNKDFKTLLDNINQMKSDITMNGG